MPKNEENPGHRQRLREKYFSQGIEALSEEELVELLLTLGQPRRNCKPMARAAIKRFGGLRGVLAADPADLAEIEGLGERSIIGLRLVHETGRRFLRARLMGRDFVYSTKETFDYLYHALRDKGTEAFQVLYLDAKNGVLAVEEPFKGSVAGVKIEPQVILRQALLHKAAQFVCAHNHPSGDVRPSTDDIRLTEQLATSASVIGLKLVDHLIIGENNYYSFAESGQLRRF